MEQRLPLAISLVFPDILLLYSYGMQLQEKPFLLIVVIPMACMQSHGLLMEIGSLLLATMVHYRYGRLPQGTCSHLTKGVLLFLACAGLLITSMLQLVPAIILYWLWILAMEVTLPFTMVILIW